MTIALQSLLIGQLEFYWDAHLRPRLRGLTTKEYLWEPVPGCWSIRPDAQGRHVADWAHPPPDPAPVTTIAWRMAHIAIDCFAIRTDMFFGNGSRGWEDLDLPVSASGGLELLERSYAGWRDAIAGLDEEDLAAPLGRKGGLYAEEPMAALVLHISRETMHHGGEIGVLRDLYRAGMSA